MLFMWHRPSCLGLIAVFHMSEHLVQNATSPNDYSCFFYRFAMLFIELQCFVLLLLMYFLFFYSSNWKQYRLSLQNRIIPSSRIIGRLAVGGDRMEAKSAIVEFRKADESMQDRLFVLQVWRRYDQETADKLARKKAGEFLDPELSEKRDI